MASPIEDIIEEIEEYIDGCKSSAFSSSKIIVNRDEIEGLINALKEKIPGEVSRYQKIINNRDAIIEDARRQAKEIISQAEIHTNELVSEHQIMQQAYAQANEVVMIATKDAQHTLDSATSDANEIRRSAISYTDGLLATIQEVLARSIDTTRSKQEQYISTMQGYLDTVIANRMQLSPNPIVEEVVAEVAENRASHANEASNEPTETPSAPSSEESESQMVDTIDNPIVFNPDKKKDDSPREDIVEGIIDIPEQFFKKD